MQAAKTRARTPVLQNSRVMDQFCNRKIFCGLLYLSLSVALELLSLSEEIAVFRFLDLTASEPQPGEHFARRLGGLPQDIGERPANASAETKSWP